VKPFHNAELIKTIEKRLQKFDAIKENAAKEFNRLFDLSPNGIMLFDQNTVYNINPVLRNLLHIDHLPEGKLAIDELIDADSLKMMNQRFQQKLIEGNSIFDGVISFKSIGNEGFQMNIAVYEFERFSKFTVYIGVLTAIEESSTNINNGDYADEVYKLLQRENIKISESLGEEITNIFKIKDQEVKCLDNGFFTKRENQVLCLAMEGLPIKLIADRLEISDRTVEKYRTKLMEKTGSNNMIEVIVFALKNSLIEL